MEFVLDPGDMLYLPPRYAHDGVAVGECMTYSIGFRSPSKAELAAELLLRLADDVHDSVGDALYRDPKQIAVVQSGAIPDLRWWTSPAAHWLTRCVTPWHYTASLGEYLTEPKDQVSFQAGAVQSSGRQLILDRRTRMMYDTQHVFLNGDSFLASGRDAQLMRQLADGRCLDASDVQRLSKAARGLVDDWCEAGWMHVKS
jgi:50S ribosomal protein L16 3-hydroxylase